MKIVVLDGFTLNPGDLSWDGLKRLGEVTIYDRTPADKVLQRCKDAEVLFTNKTPLGEDVIKELHALKFIGVLATGYNIVAIEAATDCGVLVANVPGYSAGSVAQLTFALLLELCHHVQRHSDSVMEGKWSGSPDFSFWDFPLIELAGKTMGIIGFGAIGQKVGDLASAFGMNILAAGRNRSDQRSYSDQRKDTDQSHRQNFKWASVAQLLEESDVVSIHCPLTPETRGLINKDSLMQMKRSAFLLNTSRGPIIVEEDLSEALKSGTIAGAGLDVLSVEPPASGNPLFGVKNCIITPHIAWATKEARTRLMEKTVENLTAFLAGRPVNIVNG